MRISKLTHESGEIGLRAKFVSLRLIKDALGKENKIKIIEETTNSLWCQVHRTKYNFGGAKFLCPTIFLKIETQPHETILLYDFFWPDYYIAAFAVLIFTVGSIISIIKTGMQFHAGALAAFFIFVFCLAGLITFWEARHCSKRLRKSLKEI